jgi:hypothetical protein
LNMVQYKIALTIQGIIYADSISDFDKIFYTEIVGMGPEAVGALTTMAQKMAKQRRSTAIGMRKGKRDRLGYNVNVRYNYY